jgi:hypothetical protein
VFSAVNRSCLKPLGLALAGLEAWVGLVDDVNAAFATDQLVVAVALHQALEGIANFHNCTYMGGLKPPVKNLRCP